MKIFINARFLTQPVSGVQRYAIECSRQIKKIYPEVVFVAPKNIFNKEIATELNATIIGRNEGHRWEQIDLPLYLARNKRPPLISFANTAPVLYSNNYVAIHDLAFHHHPEWNSKAFSTWYNILIPRVASGARHIFTVSRSVKAEIEKHYHIDARKISVTYNGVSQGMLQRGRGEDVAKEKIILSVGTFNTRKNHEKLVKAFLASSIKNEYQLVLIGDKSKVFSETNLDEALLEGNNIKVMQHLTEPELISMYQRAEVVVSLSMYEGFGIPLLEGLYNGCKIVCSDIPVYRDVYEGHARFCDPYDLKSIGQALEESANGVKPDYAASAPLFERYSYERSAKTIVDRVLAGKPQR